MYTVFYGEVIEKQKMAAKGSDGMSDAAIDSLESLMLTDIKETGDIIGKGSYGTVFKVKRWGTLCAAKRLHDFKVSLQGGVPGVGVPRDEFERECLLLSSLRHPNIIQLLGLYIDRDKDSPVFVMEYLPMSLASCLEARPRLIIPLHLQVSILRNVAHGLAYLHCHSPPFVHGELTANNVLLTTDMVAKICDIGVTSMLKLAPRKNFHLSQAPGTVAYMPPEHSHSTKTDIFSFGVLIVHMVCQDWPVPSEAVRASGATLTPVSETSRRQRYLDVMGKNHCMMSVVTQCLQNDASLRPTVTDLVDTLESLHRSHPVPTTSYLNLLQVLENNHHQLEAKGVQLAANKEQLETIGTQLETSHKELHQLRRKVTAYEKSMVDAIKDMLMSADTPPDSTKKPAKATALHPTQAVFVWKRDADLPEGMAGARALLLEDKLYIGGGDTKEVTSDCAVYEYDINGLVRKWTPLPKAPVAHFALAEVNKSLTLVGGLDTAKKSATNHLTVWDRGMMKWVNPFPHMPSARQDPTIATHHLWLLVAGGLCHKKPVMNVDLFDSATFQWQTIQPLPRPNAGMTSCIINNTWYLLGGTSVCDGHKGENGPKESVFALSLEGTFAINKWTTLPDTPLYFSSAVPFGDFLMAVGGCDSVSSRLHSSAMFLFSPHHEKWLHVGDMPTPRSRATCVVLSRGRLLILGGLERKVKYGRTVDMLSC